MLNYAELRKFLAQDKLAKLIEALHTATSRLDADLNNQVVTIAGRLTRVTSQLNTGQISHVEANQERSRISAALLDIINQLEANYPATRQQPEPQQSQRRVRPVAQPQQSRSTWPYVLAGVVGCIIVLGIIGNMMQSGDTSNLGASTALQESTAAPNTPTQPSTKQPSGGTRKFTDQRPDPSTPASTGYSAGDLVGAWEFSAAESGVQMLVHIQLNNDRSFQSQAYLNGAAFSSDAGTWNLVGSMFHQNSSTGTEISRLSWISRNQFRLTNPEEGISIILSRLE